MKLSNSSKLLIKNINMFKDKKVLFSGYFQDFLLKKIKNNFLKIHLQKYHYKKFVSKKNFKNLIYDSKFKKYSFKKINFVIYLWSKNKLENYFHMNKIFSKILLNTKIIIIGENNSGVNSVKNFFKSSIGFKKIKYGVKSSLYYGFLKKKIFFNKKKYYKQHQYNKKFFKFLPGVFGYKKIDEASKYFVKNKKFKKFYKKILDIGSGSGFLLISLCDKFKYKKIVLSESCYTSFYCLKKNLKKNNINANPIISNIFSNIKEKFDLIISNPPIHENLKFSMKTALNIIKESKKYLKKNGEIQIVSISSLSYFKNLKKIFKNCKIIKQNNLFKIYQSFNYY
ncbi:Ribosomal RNA small subunit methyltransferase C [Buchnera aphidicola (Drepanosiphum platanoidis)]